MTAYRLTTRIAINLIFLLSVSMILIDIVMISFMQKHSINSEVSKYFSLLLSVQQNILLRPSFFHQSDSNIFDYFKPLISESNYNCFLFISPDLNPYYFLYQQCPDNTLIENICQKAINTQEKQIIYFGNTWGVIWKSYRYVLIALPIKIDDQSLGAIGITISLEKIYSNLRHIHLFFILYIVLNIFLLTFVGISQFSKITVKPLIKLIKKTELYQDDSDLLVLDESNGREFSMLSKTFSRMLHKISSDKKNLETSIQSLEKANLELKQAQREIIRAEKMASIGRLASGIAHEIGNPISIVLGYLELLKREDITKEEQKEFIIRTESEIHRIHEIIRQLLDLSRSSDFKTTPVSIHSVINDIVNLIKIHPKFSTISFCLNLFASQDIIIADSNQLRQVFINLLINSADAIESSCNNRHGQIIIESSNEIWNNDQNSIVIKIIDNGIGIPQNHIDLIFDPFYTTKEPGKGTGLGLSVSIKIIESFDGNIVVESKEHQGTTVKLIFPIADPGTLKES